jgi:hypothetical protein
MDRMEKAVEVLARAERVGLRPEFDSGLLVVKRAVSGDPTRQDDIIAEIGKYLTEVRRLVYHRAMAVRANDFFGQRIWSEEGDGVLASASIDGNLAITMTKEGFRHRQTVTSKPESLFIIVDEAKADGVSSREDEQAAEKTGGGLFKRLMS